MRFRCLRYVILGLAALLNVCQVSSDVLPGKDAVPLRLSLEGNLTGDIILSNNSYLKGDNLIGKNAFGSLSGDLRCAFKYNPESKVGILYPGLYQGLGIKAQTFFSKLLGSPTSVYIFQGAPFKKFGKNFSLGYEWEFGAAFGWKYYRSNISAISTRVTAHMGIRLRLNQNLSNQWKMFYSIGLTHFSNGNTEFANNGINNGGVAVGISYSFKKDEKEKNTLVVINDDSDQKKWYLDIVGFGAWRKRLANVSETQQIWQGKYGVAGISGSYIRTINRWFAAGPSIDILYDSSAGLEPYWIPGTTGNAIRHSRVPFGKHISAGVSARCEFIMPIFTINAGIGVDIKSPPGNGRVYQMLSLKTYVTDFLYINVGYRLANFKDSQHLMLGLGVRI